MKKKLIEILTLIEAFCLQSLLATFKIMMQNMSIAYMRGFEGKPKPKYIKGSLVEKKYNEGAYDRKNNLPNRYLK